MQTTTTLPPRYRDPRPLGSGGMGEILRATDDELGRDVAVKVLAERFAQDPDIRARFKREALAAGRLSAHPHIVTIFDVDEFEGRPLIVMELMPGGSLERRVAAGPRPSTAQILSWLEDAASALDAAHAAGIVHRDVKPGNLLLDGRGHVQMADFGIATAADTNTFTQTGTILGTAGYLSPEQSRGERATAASDLYSLAVVAWELLAGRRPFEAGSPTAEAAAHLHAPIPSLHAQRPDLPPALDAVFARGLAKDPAQRYPSAEVFVGELRRAMHDGAAETRAFYPTQRYVGPPRRTRWWIPVAVVLLLAAGAGLAAVLATRGGSGNAAAASTPVVTRTVTSQGTTVQETVTAPAVAASEPTTAPTTTPAAAPTPTPTPPATPPGQAKKQDGGDGSSLNDEGYAKMQAGDYHGALPLLEQAVADLQGSGATTEAYASYNLAYTRYALGQCDGVLDLLDRAASIEGDVSAIQRLRAQAQKTC